MFFKVISSMGYKKLLPMSICLLFFLGIASCTLQELEAPGNLVPPTADLDPLLPQLKITVAGHNRAIHLQTFGNPDNPPLFILHGGPGADFRIFLPFKCWLLISLWSCGIPGVPGCQKESQRKNYQSTILIKKLRK
jgi:hypothetical protein